MTFEDAEMLRHLAPPAQRAMEKLLHEQAREQQRYDQLITSQLVQAERFAERTRCGAGGGRRRHPQPADEDTLNF